MTEDHPHYGPHAVPHPQPGDAPSTHSPEPPPANPCPEPDRLPSPRDLLYIPGVTLLEDPIEINARVTGRTPEEVFARIQELLSRYHGPSIRKSLYISKAPDAPPAGPEFVGGANMLEHAEKEVKRAMREAGFDPRAEDEATRPLAADLVRPSNLTVEDARQIRRGLEEARAAASGLWATLEEWRLQSTGMDAAEAAHHRHKMGEAVARAVGRIEATVHYALDTMDTAAVRRA